MHETFKKARNGFSGGVELDEWMDALRQLCPEQADELIAIARTQLPLSDERAARFCSLLSGDCEAKWVEALAEHPSNFRRVVEENTVSSDVKAGLDRLLPDLFEQAAHSPELYGAIASFVEQLDDTVFERYASMDLKKIIRNDALYQNTHDPDKQKAVQALLERVGGTIAQKTDPENLERFLPDALPDVRDPAIVLSLIRGLPRTVQRDLIIKQLPSKDERPEVVEALVEYIEQNLDMAEILGQIADGGVLQYDKLQAIHDCMDDPTRLHEGVAALLTDSDPNHDRFLRNGLIGFLDEWNDNWGDIDEIIGPYLSHTRRGRVVEEFVRLGGTIDGETVKKAVRKARVDDQHNFVESILQKADVDQQMLDEALRDHVEALVTGADPSDPAVREKTLNVFMGLVGHGARPNPPEKESLFLFAGRTVLEADPAGAKDQDITGRILRTLLDRGCGPPTEERKAVFELFLARGFRPPGKEELLRDLTTPQFHPTPEQLSALENQAQRLHEAVTDNMSPRQVRFADQGR